jgi:signal transduction histidine kinase
MKGASLGQRTLRTAEERTFSRVHNRITLPLSLLAAVLIAVATPLTWFHLEQRAVMERGRQLAGLVAKDLEPLMDTHPQLWRYNRSKVGALLKGRAGLLDHDHLEIRDPLWREVAATGDGEARGVQVRLTLPGEAGTVLVTMSTAGALHKALLMLLLFSLLGVTAAGTLYRLPQARIKRAEEELLGNLVELEAARADLARLNSSLEAMVEQRTAALEAANLALSRQGALLSQLAKDTFRGAEDERLRISQELHDSVGQMLVAVRLWVEERLPGAGAGEAPLLRLRGLVEETSRMLRASIESLGTPIGELGGLRGAVELALGSLRGPGRQLQLRWGLTPDAALPNHLQSAFLQSCQEALNNAVRHGQAKEVWVDFLMDGGDLVMTVSDDGRGFDPTLTPPGLGLRGMHRRAALLGGTITIQAAPGAGTVLTLRAPLGAGTEGSDEDLAADRR